MTMDILWRIEPRNFLSFKQSVLAWKCKTWNRTDKHNRECNEAWSGQTLGYQSQGSTRGLHWFSIIHKDILEASNDKPDCDSKTFFSQHIYTLKKWIKNVLPKFGNWTDTIFSNFFSNKKGGKKMFKACRKKNNSVIESSHGIYEQSWNDRIMIEIMEAEKLSGDFTQFCFNTPWKVEIFQYRFASTKIWISFHSFLYIFSLCDHFLVSILFVTNIDSVLQVSSTKCST